jgi:hypothetical protein
MNKNKKLSAGLILFSLIVGCCSTTPSSIDNDEHNVEFSKYLESFKKDMGSRVKTSDLKKTSIRFGNLKSPEVGLCAYIPIWGHSVITIDRNTWLKYSELERMDLIYHELGHCVCGLGHGWEFGAYPEARLENIITSYSCDDGFFEDGCPMSLMYPYIMNKDCTKKHWADYTKDLYNRCRP